MIFEQSPNDSSLLIPVVKDSTGTWYKVGDICGHTDLSIQKFDKTFTWKGKYTVKDYYKSSITLEGIGSTPSADMSIDNFIEVLNKESIFPYMEGEFEWYKQGTAIKIKKIYK